MYTCEMWHSTYSSLQNCGLYQDITQFFYQVDDKNSILCSFVLRVYLLKVLLQFLQRNSAQTTDSHARQKTLNIYHGPSPCMPPAQHHHSHNN